jgi:hypothetical protein
MAREVGKVERKATDATEAHKLSFPMAGKVVYAVQKRLEQLKASVDETGKAKKPQISLATSLATYWESITRANGKPGIKLNNHWLSCAVTFGTYVGSELISEPDYDKNPAANLELAASISTAVGGDVTHAAVMSAAEELRDRSKNSAKTLREILESVKEPKAMTAEKAQEMVAKIIAGGHLSVVIASVGAEIAHLEDAEAARSAFFGMITASDMFAANMMTKEIGADGKPVQVRRFSDKVLDAWTKAYEKANAQTPANTETSAPESTASTPAQLQAAA